MPQLDGETIRRRAEVRCVTAVAASRARDLDRRIGATADVLVEASRRDGLDARGTRVRLDREMMRGTLVPARILGHDGRQLQAVQHELVSASQDGSQEILGAARGRDFARPQYRPARRSGLSSAGRRADRSRSGPVGRGEAGRRLARAKTCRPKPRSNGSRNCSPRISKTILAPVAKKFAPDPALKPHVVLVVGVNGSGKTTTIGKLGGVAGRRRQARDAGGGRYVPCGGRVPARHLGGTRRKRNSYRRRKAATPPRWRSKRWRRRATRAATCC